ncbi:MAG: hypothetical protein VB092_07640 [Oscillospiraceae bacterium]|nr:hypothetical protein [Oscillospiraceae bacterium]
MKKNSENKKWRRGALLSALLAVLVLAAAFFGLRAAADALEGQTLSYARDSVCRAAALCYAVEGVYPEDVDYLAAHYGLSLDRERYIYHYNALGGNLFPEIYVIAKPAA